MAIVNAGNLSFVQLLKLLIFFCFSFFLWSCFFFFELEEQKIGEPNDVQATQFEWSSMFDMATIDSSSWNTSEKLVNNLNVMISQKLWKEEEKTTTKKLNIIEYLCNI